MNSPITRSFLLATTVTIACYLVIFSLLEFDLFAYGFNKSLAFNKVQVLRVTLLSLFTLFGIIFGVLYEQTEKAKDKDFNFFAVVKKSYTTKQAWLAILASPIVIISFYPQIQSIDSIPLICLVSFQNGFFFKSILQMERSAKKS